ncbi:unnamed protein product [Heterobilharzia americana]|nr:unnamed protein product [Heterobilharzia americana]
MIPYGYKLPKHEIDSQALINQVPSPPSSSVYYGKNEMLQQYQPFHGNRYLFPPAWGTGRIRYFGDARNSDLTANYQSTRPFHHNQMYQHIQQQSTIHQTNPITYSRNSVYQRHSGRFPVNMEDNSQLPWRFAYTYPQSKSLEVEKHFSVTNHFEPRSPFKTYNLHSSKSTPLQSKSSILSSSKRMKSFPNPTLRDQMNSKRSRTSSTWHVRPVV